jgi:subtilisin family serine protease
VSQRRFPAGRVASRRLAPGRGRVVVVTVLAAASIALPALAAMSTTATASPGDRTGGPTRVLDQQFHDGTYIVLLADEPVATYDGDVAGLAATKPEDGEKVDADSAAAGRYAAFLEQRQQEVRERAGVEETIVDYTTVVNGFAAELTAGQAAVLATDKRVLSVSPDTIRHLDTVRSPEFLGLTGPTGVWSRLGGTNRYSGAGSGVVVGVIDTGIWPEARSFRPTQPGDRPPPGTWKGECEAGEDFTPDLCNDKLIGARWYVDSFGAEAIDESDYLSPRDGNGHGTHTASTAAGDFGFRAISDDRVFGRASGMAPAAFLAAYKACWTTVDGDGCGTLDLVSAIDDAVADGVDIINFSIGNASESEILDPIQYAFLKAAAAGVFVAASAGNSGPGASTLDHPSPWLTTVAASTHTVNESTVALGNGKRYIGASITPGIAETPAVLAAEAAAEGVAVEDARLCLPGTLDRATVTGKIVVCDRGVNARVEKSLVVRDAGGVGLILVNTAPGSLNADNHFLPSIHLSHEASDAVYGYVGGNPDATAAILAGVNAGSQTQVPEVAEFSSRGPSESTEGDILKPDIAAPGVDVIAAVAPPGNYGRSWDFASGTSMAAPHIAGLAALIREAHPDWSPMAIKSAMMTTAYDHAGAQSRSAFAQGAGFVDPTRFLDPGLVYDSDLVDWLRYLEGQGVDALDLGPIDASDLNQASVAVGEMAGEQTVTRRVTNVGARTATYRAQVSGLEGVDVSVSPDRLRLAPGQTAEFTVTLPNSGAVLGDYVQGHLTWSDGQHSVRSPVVARPVAVAAPAEVSGAGAAGAEQFPVTAGFDGELGMTVRGLVPGDVTAETVRAAPGSLAFTPDAYNDGYEVDVAEGVSLARFRALSPTPGDDLDLVVLGPDSSQIVAFSADLSADEQVDLFAPEPGRYTVIVNGYAAANGDTVDYTFTSHQVGGEDAGNASVTPNPAAVETAEILDVTLEWAGLDPDLPYLGLIGYDGAPTPTVVSISPAIE